MFSKKSNSISTKATNTKLITANLNQNLSEITAIFKDDRDFSIRHFHFSGTVPAALVYLNTLVDQDMIAQNVLKALKQQQNGGNQLANNINKTVMEEIIYPTEIQESNNLTTVVNSIIQGHTIILIAGHTSAYYLSTYKIPERSVTQPESEQVIRGPHDGFVENLATNISLIRYRLSNQSLRITPKELGKQTKTKIAVLYVENLVDNNVREEVEHRLNAITTNRILDTSYLEQLIQDRPRSPFPQLLYTERPDVIVGNLLEGRVAIMTDGSPGGLIAPATITQFIQTSSDYNQNFMISSFIRLIRVLALILSLVTPSFYVAVVSYHPELIPTRFAIAITSGRTGVPFALIMEVFIMEIIMEILREATIRMPKQIGNAISIVGVLVIGQAAVEAGFVSPLTVVFVAITTIGSFATPNYSMGFSFRLLRFFSLLLTGLLGFYGFMISWMIIMNHLLSLRSFGVPYMSPISPVHWKGLRDSIIKAPIKWLINRQKMNKRNME